MDETLPDDYKDTREAELDREKYWDPPGRESKKKVHPPFWVPAEDEDEMEEDVLDSVCPERTMAVNVTDMSTNKSELLVEYFQTLDDYWKIIHEQLDAGEEPEAIPEKDKKLAELEKEMESKGYVKISEVW